MKSDTSPKMKKDDRVRVKMGDELDAEGVIVNVREFPIRQCEVMLTERDSEGKILRVIVESDRLELKEFSPTAELFEIRHSKQCGLQEAKKILEERERKIKIMMIESKISDFGQKQSQNFNAKDVHEILEDILSLIKQTS